METEPRSIRQSGLAGQAEMGGPDDSGLLITRNKGAIGERGQKTKILRQALHEPLSRLYLKKDWHLDRQRDVGSVLWRDQ